jgi:glycine/D-amino acid oxidase-like deaminating enzyme
MTAGAPRAVVIGGGFYGCAIAEFLSRAGLAVVLLEAEDELLTRSSYHNQARLHGGYHYPRSFSTAFRSRINLARFIDDFRPAVEADFIKLYAVARHNSWISARQFESFCQQIDAPIRPAGERFERLFSDRLIERVYRAEEYVFNAAVLRSLMRRRLAEAGASVRCGSRVFGVEVEASGGSRVVLASGQSLPADFVFNCTYSGLNAIRGMSAAAHQLKHEITELALVELPPELAGISVTVMDGPFFSFMPFPDRRLSTLTHVRYTPHASWLESGSETRSPHGRLLDYAADSRFPFMVRDAARYMPVLAETHYRDSLFEVKTVLAKNEVDDGRPILFEWAPDRPRLVSVLGSKIDNIYDVLIAVEEHIREHRP